MPANSVTPTDLKTILHSKRANIYYLEKCRIQVNGGRVEYVTQEGKESFYWNIPIANTTAVMLGMGTSVTQMAMREFVENAQDHTSLMLQEALLTKSLYKLTSQTVGYGTFTRAKRGGGADIANRFLDQGNYLAYGLAAVAAWVTGIPHGLAVMHGKTRRGGLVFDIADLIKDALVMPQAFIAAMEGEDNQQFRQRCINAFQQAEALDVMIATLQETSHSLVGVEK
ncbi:type I-F CRISPR-associated endonuclease Cas1f [Enterobacter bugandensis]|uniref:type I-F CRISPR-associated endonuclease Cas1f n=1 Tax=Enterobacter bugandensis TaxID=881260 RepID=UPI00283AAEC4|nr:type I-F CRISPR-associated endonuclease Cas1f [Enterobacter bugandensis]WMU44063.1 type I-F CRISPR-associated endonuclease Cas1f [Enterobacter bugandensis]